MVDVLNVICSRPPEDFEALVEEMLKGEAPNEYEGDTGEVQSTKT